MCCRDFFAFAVQSQHRTMACAVGFRSQPEYVARGSVHATLDLHGVVAVEVLDAKGPQSSQSQPSRRPKSGALREGYVAI